MAPSFPGKVVSSEWNGAYSQSHSHVLGKDSVGAVVGEGAAKYRFMHIKLHALPLQFLLEFVCVH